MLTYLSQRLKSEARLRIMLSAGECGGRQVGAQTAQMGLGSRPSHHREAGGAGGPTGLFYCRYVLLSAWWGTSSQSPPLS